MRKYLLYIALFVLPIAGIVFMPAPKAHAATTANGYFTNISDSSPYSVPGGGTDHWCELLGTDCYTTDAGLGYINPITHDAPYDNKDTFINYMQDKLNLASSNPGNVDSIQQSVGAAYIIEAGLGQGAHSFSPGMWSDYVAAAKADFSTWAAAIRNPDIGLSVQTATYDKNTAFSRHNNIDDIMQYDDSDSAMSVIIYSTKTYPSGLTLQCMTASSFCPQYKGVYMIIKGDCGNPVGKFVGLPQVTDTKPIGILRITCSLDDSGNATAIARMWWHDEDGIQSSAYIRPTPEGTPQLTPTATTDIDPSGNRVYEYDFSAAQYNAYNGKYFQLIVNNKNSDGTSTGAIYSVGDGTSQTIPDDCNVPPKATMTMGCSFDSGITLSGVHDDNVPDEGRFRIEVSQDGAINAAGAKHIYSGFTTNGSLTIPWQSATSPDLLDGTSVNNGDPRRIVKGDYPDWTQHSYWVYVVDQDANGNATSSAQEVQIFDGGVTANGVIHHPAPGPCAHLSCGALDIDGDLVAGGSNKLTFHTTVDQALSQPPVKSPYTVTINGAVVSSFTYDTANSTNDDIRSIAVDYPLPSGKYTIKWGWTYPGITANNDAAPTVCSKPVEVGPGPYFTVTGGDIATGTPFYDSDGATCSQDPADLKVAGIKSWNLDNKNGSGWNGAGTEYAALATGPIKSFLTNSKQVGDLNTMGGTFKPTDLSFANTATPLFAPVGISNGQYGGGMGDLGCMENYYAKYWALRKPTDPIISGNVTTALHNDASYTEYYSGNVNLTSPNPSDDQRITGGHAVTIVTQGSVYIGSNITYGYGAIKAIPNVTIIAKGGIYLSSNVTELHGTFVSQGNTTNGKVFATCAVVTGSFFKESTKDSDNCNQQLKIVGSVNAQTIHLDRTFGNFTDSASGPAETFQYSPEGWLTQTAGPLCTTDCKYTSISGLPPVL